MRDALESYRQKQEEKVQTTLVPHSQRYHEKLKRLKTPPSPSKASYGKNKY
jgi:hypothetical protein